MQAALIAGIAFVAMLLAIVVLAMVARLLIKNRQQLRMVGGVAIGILLIQGVTWSTDNRLAIAAFAAALGVFLAMR